MDFVLDNDEEDEGTNSLANSASNSSSIDTMSRSAVATKRDDEEDDDLPGYYSKGPKLSQQQVLAMGKDLVREFLASKTAYDLMPKAGRVVVFDVGIPLRSVLGGLLENDIKGAPLWRPDEQKLVGVITLTDFADLYRHCYLVKDPNPNLIMEAHTVSSWRVMLAKRHFSNTQQLPGAEVAASLVKERANVLRPLYSLKPTHTVLEAITMLLKHEVNRMPVIDPESETMLHMMTLQTILDYMVGHFMADRNGFLEESIYNMNIGTYCEPAASKVLKLATPKPAKDLVMATSDMTMNQVCDLCAKHNVSIVPIVDPKTNWVRDLFNRAYLPRLRWNDANWFERPISEVIDKHANRAGIETVHTCNLRDSLVKVINQFYETKARMLVVVEHDDCVGVVTLHDVFGHFV